MSEYLEHDPGYDISHNDQLVTPVRLAEVALEPAAGTCDSCYFARQCGTAYQNASDASQAAYQTIVDQEAAGEISFEKAIAAGNEVAALEDARRRALFLLRANVSLSNCPGVLMTKVQATIIPAVFGRASPAKRRAMSARNIATELHTRFITTCRNPAAADILAADPDFTEHPKPRFQLPGL